MKKLMLALVLGTILIISPPSPVASAADDISFTWSSSNPASIAGATIFRGLSTGIDREVIEGSSRFCILFNGSSKYIEAAVYKTMDSWYGSSSWREDRKDTCFAPSGSFSSDVAISDLEFQVYLPQNLPTGRLEIKIQITDKTGKTFTSQPLVVQNNAQQPELKVTGLQEGATFSQDGEFIKVLASLSKIYTWATYPNESTNTNVKSWCFGLTETDCLPVTNESCGSLCSFATLDTRSIPSGSQKLYVSIVDTYGRTVRHPAISFTVKSTPPILLEVYDEKRSATWKDRTVSHTVFAYTGPNALPINQDLYFGTSKTSQPKKASRVDEGVIDLDGKDVRSTKYTLKNLKPSTTYWVKVKLTNPAGTTIKVFRIKSRSIPKKPAPQSGTASNGGYSSSSCYVGMNWKSCINTLGYEPKFYDCSGNNRWSINNSNWWIIGKSGGRPLISKSPNGCS
jgi:hypothetical protein